MQCDVWQGRSMTAEIEEILTSLQPQSIVKQHSAMKLDKNTESSRLRILVSLQNTTLQT